MIITNTVTAEDKQMLTDHKVKLLVTATPEYDGRYYATNVFEGVLVTLLGKKPEDVTVDDYEALLARMGWKPTISKLSRESEVGSRESGVRSPESGVTVHVIDPMTNDHRLSTED